MHEFSGGTFRGAGQPLSSQRLVMFSILFYLVSFTRTTVAYLSKRFPNVIDRLKLPEIEYDDSEGNLDLTKRDVPDSAVSSSRASGLGKKSRGRNVTDAVVRNPMRYGDDEDEEELQYLSSQITKLPVGRDDLVYNMGHTKRGKCVIFSHDEFDNAPLREGSEADVAAIEHTFGKLGFTVKKHPNYSYQSIQDTITELAKDDYSDQDCLCIFMLTHGTSNGLIYAKDCVYPVLEIWKPFTVNCESLAGKPKLFFFQACRGNKLENGIKVYNMNASVTDSPVSTSYKIPTHADFLLAYSTTEGFYSWRHVEKGTWYVQCLCNIINKYWVKTDLLSMLTTTARSIANDYSSDEPGRADFKQMPSLTSTLTRKLFFTPKNDS